VTAVDELKAWVEQAIKNFLVPSTFTHDVRVVNLARAPILAVNVPASRTSVALYDDQSRAIEYVHRTSHGRDWMNPDEVERHIMNGSRAARIALNTAKASATTNEIDLAGGVMHRRGRGIQDHPIDVKISLGDESNEETFSLQIAIGAGVHRIRLPYGVVREAWIGANGRVNLLLSVRLVQPNGRGFVIEPYDS
jgi:hypothetical protein